MRKGYFNFLVFICLFLPIMHACSSGKQQFIENVKLKVAIFDGAYNNGYWNEIAKRFEKEYPHVDVEVDINENIGNILLPRIDGNSLPDVVYLGSSNASGFTQEMIKERKIASLSEIFTPKFEERFMENVLENYAIRPYEDQEVYLAPLYFNVTGLWYNQSLFTKHGYDVPSTWDEFFALGEQAKADGISLFIYQGLNPTYLEAILWPMLAEKIGLDGLQDIYQNKENAWSQEGVTEVLSTISRLSSYMQAETISLTYMQAQKRFIEGKALFLPCGNWLEMEMQKAIKAEDEFRFMNVPSYEKDKKQYVSVMLEQIYVPKNAKQEVLGKQFIAFQFEQEHVALNQQISGGYVPIMQDMRTIKHQPFQIFNEDITAISANFSPLLNIDMNREVFEQVSNILAKSSTVQEAIDYLNIAINKGL